MKILNTNKPWLMLSSPEKPEERLLYDVFDQEEKEKGQKEKEIKISLPSFGAAVAGGHRRPHHCLGTSEGFVISIEEGTDDITAVNPLTHQQLPIPSTAGVLRLPTGKAILSPSCDAIVFIANEHPIFSPIVIGGGSSSWTILPQTRYYFLDCIFHKGLLCCVDFCDVVLYDLDSPLAPPLFSDTPYLSKLSIGEGMASRMEPSTLSPSLLEPSTSRQSAFHVNPTLTGADLSPNKRGGAAGGGRRGRRGGVRRI